MSCSPARPSTRPSSAWCGHQIRRNTLRIDSATASRMPGSTPSSATPSRAIIDSQNSIRRCCHSRRVAGDVGERQRGRDDDGAEGGLRHVLHQPGREHQDEGDDRGADHPGHLRPGPGLLRDGGARPAGADREALEEAGGDVGGTDADHLLVAAHLLARGGRRTTRPSTSCRPERPRRWRPRRGTASGCRTTSPCGTVNGGNPWGSTPMVSTPVVLQVEEVDGEGGQHHDDEHARGSWAAAGAAAGCPTSDDHADDGRGRG